MASVPLISFSTTQLEVNYLFCLAGLLNCGIDPSFMNLWASNRCVVKCTNHQDIIETQLLANSEGHLFNHNSVTNSHFVLAVHKSENGENLVGSWRKCDANLRVVNVQNFVLTLDGLHLGLSFFAPSFLDFLFREWHTPFPVNFIVLADLVELPSHRFSRCLIELFEVGAELHYREGVPLEAKQVCGCEQSVHQHF